MSSAYALGDFFVFLTALSFPFELISNLSFLLVIFVSVWDLFDTDPDPAF